MARTHRLIEMHLQHGDTLFARSSGGRSSLCAPHPELPHVHVVDTSALTVEGGEPDNDRIGSP